MVQLEDIAQAAVDGEALLVRSLVQDWASEASPLARATRPVTTDRTVLTVAAALAELFALRRGEPAPAWTAEIGPLDEPLYLVASAATLPRLRRMCELEAPDSLRRRRIYAPPDYLSAA